MYHSLLNMYISISTNHLQLQYLLGRIWWQFSILFSIIQHIHITQQLSCLLRASHAGNSVALKSVWDLNAKCTLLHWLFHNIVGDLNIISKPGLLGHFIFLLCHSIILNLYETKNYVSYKHISQLRILLNYSAVIKKVFRTMYCYCFLNCV